MPAACMRSSAAASWLLTCLCGLTALRYDYDLDAWRAGSYLPNKEFELLDADNQAGEHFL